MRAASAIFHARALAATGESERALGEYESLIRDLPLCYYMLSAYSVLYTADTARCARAVLAGALAAVPSGPVVVTNRAEFFRLGLRSRAGAVRGWRSRKWRT